MAVRPAKYLSTSAILEIQSKKLLRIQNDLGKYKRILNVIQTKHDDLTSIDLVFVNFEMFVIVFLFYLYIVYCHLFCLYLNNCFIEISYDFGTIRSSYPHQQFWHHLNMILLKYYDAFKYY